MPDKGEMSGASRSRIVVIGGGVIGVTSAYLLARRGHSVTLLEARENVGLETSYANGAILTPSMSDPWNGPGVHWRLAASLFDPHSPMKLRLGALPGLATWGLRFLRHSSAKRHAWSTDCSYQLSAYSVRRTAQLRAELDLAYEASDRGTVKLFRDHRAMAGPLALAERLARQGLPYRVLDPDETVALEPALAPIGAGIAGDTAVGLQGYGRDGVAALFVIRDVAADPGGKARLCGHGQIQFRALIGQIFIVRRGEISGDAVAFPDRQIQCVAADT